MIFYNLDASQPQVVQVYPGRYFYFLILQNKNRPPLPRNAPLIYQWFFYKKEGNIGKKNLLEDLPGGKE